MATFNPIIKAETINNCADLKITDQSSYTDIPKTAFTLRQITLKKVDGTSTIHAFPYTNTDPSIQDTISILGYFDIDYYVTVQTDFTYTDPITSAVINKSTSFNYLSACHIIRERNRFANQIMVFDNAKTEHIYILSNLDNKIESATYAANFSDKIKAQTFLDKGKDVCDYINNNYLDK